MTRAVVAAFGVAVLWVGANASADTAAETCTLELEGGVTGAWVGPCTEGKADGEGFAILLNGTYTGPAVDGLAQGQGRLTLRGGAWYEGGWAQGKRHGWGSSVDAEGNRYEGEYANGKPHGQGSGSSPGGGHHSGEWRDGEPVEEPADADEVAVAAETSGGEKEAEATTASRCTLDIAGESLAWSGPCREDGKAHGQGTATSADGTATYTGSAEGGKPHGFGTVTTTGGGYYQGDYRNGLQHGNGIFRGPDGKLYRATFADGEQSGDAVPMEGVAASDPWEDQADAGTTRPAGGTAQSGDDPLGQVEAAFPDPWGPDTTAVGSQSVGSNVPDPARGGADEFDYNDALKTLDGKDGIVRSAIPTEYEEALRHLDRQERMEVERRATESARETDDYARQLRDDIAAETARERRAEAQRERERRDAELTERAMRLEQERQAEEREQRSKALLERNLQIAALQRTLDFNLVACDSATPPRDGLRWNPNRDTSPAAEAAARQAWQERTERFRSDCRDRVRGEYQSAIGTLMLTNP